MKKFEQVEGELPKEPGIYLTNFGELKFDGKKFLMPGHKRETPTIVAYWMREINS